MTQELTETNLNLPVPNPDEFAAVVNSVLMPFERDALFAYIRSGGKPVPAVVNSAFFELFYNGCSAEDIHAINETYPVEAIQWMRIQYRWDETVIQNTMRNNALVVGKINKAQVDAAMLMTDMIAVASKRNQTRLRKYLQTGNEADLEGAMVLDNPERFSKMVESLIKLVYREEQTLQIKMPVGMMRAIPEAMKVQAQTVTTTAVNLLSETAAAIRAKSAAKARGGHE